jgi:hypothetical protein
MDRRIKFDDDPKCLRFPRLAVLFVIVELDSTIHAQTAEGSHGPGRKL